MKPILLFQIPVKEQIIKSDNSDNNPLKNYVRYTTLFIQMAVIISAGTFGGYYIDKLIGLEFPLFTILLSLGSIGASLYLTIKGIKK